MLCRRESHIFVGLCCYRFFRDILFFFKERAAEKVVVFSEVDVAFQAAEFFVVVFESDHLFLQCYKSLLSGFVLCQIFGGMFRGDAVGGKVI